ncbi:dnaJ homolog subfamily C member 16-like isoform X1 [Hydractinia symbiolongicarpus]|uniref:dnaJ homolog subfamily C member 16-like isoform X1 n=1 Tax=Hydractinia symbiolongicarpus TaxID=13093 RepID=UPI00254B2534|nr:dnaJ homolog subfamily C member 16-like isoform X1 [Hydractinia symbiolongicarpus]XP_057305909.1 dnaJ homolog subfamily C member 16-like isoform X1 [Hydractinia symbiolongicarpus]
MDIVICFCLLLLSKSTAGINPYETLNVKPSDSQKTIKAAYKKLAKEWHPDKSTDPNAQAEMVKINEAYEILSDSEKKEQFDRYGTTEKMSQQAAHHHFYHEFRKGPGGSYSFMFEDFPFGAGYHSHAQRKSNLLTRYSYQNIILPDSHHKVFLIAVFGEFCFDCLRLQPMWEKLAENMDSVGIGAYELNYDRNPHLAYDLGSQSYPQFFAVVNGRSVRYKGGEISERLIRDFISSLLPHSLVDRIVGNEREYFEQSFKDNKPQCLLFSKHIFVPLLFQVVAFEYRSKVKFAYVDVKDEQTKYFREKYNINKYDPTVVIVKEEPSLPIAVTTGSALKRGTLRELVTKNLYLYMPRLSSQTLFNELCPMKSASRRWLCIVMVTSENDDYSSHLWKLRQMAKDKQFEEKRVRFFYIFKRKQNKFLNQFENSDVHSVPCSDGSNPKDLLILWRAPRNKVLYDWFANGWCKTDDSVAQLANYIDENISGESELKYEIYNQIDLIDEHWHGMAWDFIKKVYQGVQHVVDSIDSPSWYNASSIGFIVLVVFGIMISCVIPITSEFISDTPSPSPSQHKRNVNSNTTILGLKKLDSTNQKTFIHNSPAGKVTVAVIVDSLNIDDVASSPIIQAFADAIYGYTSNSCYTFTWLSIAENLIWCTEIMNINKFGEFLPGTVLAINGFRKYIYIYKPDVVTTDNPQLSANFIGFESSEEEGDSYHQLERIKVKRAAIKLRKDFPRWIERLYEGTLPNRIKIDKWPIMES